MRLVDWVKVDPVRLGSLQYLVGHHLRLLIHYVLQSELVPSSGGQLCLLIVVGLVKHGNGDDLRRLGLGLNGCRNVFVRIA